jgi:hypothetical protein
MQFALIYIEPHTREWLDALELGDPVQAACTRAILAAVGSDEVCSLCGRKPAADYWVIARKTDPSPVPTLRLCADCVPVRAAVYEQKLIPLR